MTHTPIDIEALEAITQNDIADDQTEPALTTIGSHVLLELIKAEKERDELKMNLEAHIEDNRRMFFKALKDRPVAPHPVDQMANLTAGLLESAESEVTSLRDLLAKAGKALEPFAAITPPDRIKDKAPLTGVLPTAKAQIFALDFRRARTVLAAIQTALRESP